MADFFLTSLRMPLLYELIQTFQVVVSIFKRDARMEEKGNRPVSILFKHSKIFKL